MTSNTLCSHGAGYAESFPLENLQITVSEKTLIIFFDDVTLEMGGKYGYFKMKHMNGPLENIHQSVQCSPLQNPCFCLLKILI